MPNSAPTILRLEIDHMRERIMHAVVLRFSELTPIIAAELKRVIANFSIETQVREIVTACIRETVADAAQTAIRRAVYGAIDAGALSTIDAIAKAEVAKQLNVLAEAAKPKS